MDLIAECLDKQLVDRNGHKMGRVDGLIMEIVDGGQPTISAIEVGPVSQAKRLHPRLGRLVEAASKRWGLAQVDPFRVPWSKIVAAGIEVIAGVEAEETPALAWELWLRKNVIERMPGG